MISILVVEDDLNLNSIVCTFLNNSGYEVKGCLNAEEAYEEMYKYIFQLVISDISISTIEGFVFVKNVRRINDTIPILFLLGMNDLKFKQRGFQIGIDDYVDKPVELEELLLHVRMLLHRCKIEVSRKIEIGNLILDPDAMTAMIDRIKIEVTTKEFHIIYKLISNPNKIFSREQLMDEFWSIRSDASLRVVYVYIAKLRNKFRTANRIKIQTIRGSGYSAVLTTV